MVLRAHWRHLGNMIELLLPSAHLHPQSKRQIDRFSHSCTAHGRKFIYLKWALLSPKVSPSHGGSGPPSSTWFPSPPESSTQMASRLVQPFLHRRPQSVPRLYNGTSLLPLKIAPSHGGSESPSNTWFPGPTQVLNPNGISISSTDSAGFISDRQTDRPHYSVRKNRPHLRT